jgi:RNA methyltransferase, TrmH family
MVIRIDSEDNKKLKLVRKLRARKYRDSEGKFVIEGINLVEEALNREAGVDYIIVSEDFELDPSRLDIPRLSEEYEVYELSRQCFEKLCEAENGLGILAVVSKPAYSCEAVAVSEMLDNLGPEDNILVLDRIQDPGNIGTMIRTAVAAGYQMILCSKGTVDVWSSKVLRATAGMIFDIPVCYIDETETLISLLKKHNRRVCVTVLEDAVPYYEADISKGIALVIGNEGNGISDEMIASADERITIPMRGGVESLNAGISAAILMYEAIRD